MNTTRTGLVLAVLCGAAAFVPVHDAVAQTTAQGGINRFVGRWQLNAAQSKAAPGESVPTSLVTQIDRLDAAHVHWSTTVTDAQGQRDVETFDTPGNGEFYSLNGTTMVAHTLTPTALQSTFKDSGGQTDVVTCTLSTNANQMTCTGLVTQQGGSTAQYVDVFDRRS